MTTDEAEDAGLFTKWDTFPCQNCDTYTPIARISQFGALFVCSVCLPKLQKAEAERNRFPGLFDGRLF